MMRILLLSLLVMSGLLVAEPSEAQTAGTMTFNFTTTSTGGYSPKHLVAVWIENSSTAFVKTKLKRSSNSNLDHMNLWTSKSGNNVVDAVTGATLTSHGQLTASWNGTAVNGALVPDGDYAIWVEMAWASNMMTGKTSQSFTFTKGPDAVHLTPAGNANLSGITVDWIPATSSAGEVVTTNMISVYPNPSTGIINIDFSNLTGNTLIRVVNLLGSVAFEERTDATGPLVKSIDLSRFTKGFYFIRIDSGGERRTFKVLLN